MNTALWIGAATLAVLLVLVAAWRLRRAARTVRTILAEERALPVADGDEPVEDRTTG